MCSPKAIIHYWMIKSIHQSFRCSAIDLHLGWKCFLARLWRRNTSVAQPSHRKQQVYPCQRDIWLPEIQKGAKKCSSVAEVATVTCQSCWGFEQEMESTVNQPTYIKNTVAYLKMGTEGFSLRDLNSCGILKSWVMCNGLRPSREWLFSICNLKNLQRSYSDMMCLIHLNQKS